MEFKSQICTTIEQSERLITLGLKKETADMSISTQSFDTDNGIKYSLIPYSECKYRIMYNIIPAWSLDRLIEMLEDYKVDLYTGLNRYDEIIALIQSLIHIGGFNKDYLNMDIVEANENKNIELLSK